MRATSWASVLDELEASVIVGEQTLRTGATLTDLAPWERPHGLGPIPPELIGRARDLAERQRRVLTALPGAMVRVRRQLDLTRKIGSATAQRRPSIYIDQRA